MAKKTLFETEMEDTVPMYPYYDLLEEILCTGSLSDDRTGIGTLSLFGKQLRFNLNEGFPLLPGKFTPFNLVAAELLWMLSGSTNNEDLRALNGNDRPTIWEEWVGEDGDLGPIYGQQWRSWLGDYDGNADQIANLIKGIKERPSSRRHVVSAWNVDYLPDESVSPEQNVWGSQMALAPCHYAFQMHVDSNNRLSCMVNMRSSDTFLGLPFNIASYALLTHMIAHITDLTVGDLIMSLGDVHVYKNHIEQVYELLGRDHSQHPLPTLIIKRKIDSIDDFTLNDFAVINYQSYPAIKAPVAI